MLESGSSGSVRGVLSNEHPYREPPPEADTEQPHRRPRARDEGFSPAGAGPLRRAASSAAIARLSARP
jgi:hypothetical protein